MTKELLNIREFSDQDWLHRLYRKSESTRTRRVAESALKMFDLFCEHENITQWDMIRKLQELCKAGDTRSICLIMGGIPAAALLPCTVRTVF